jgi:uncharacterized LabA/DUF88 family protein
VGRYSRHTSRSQHRNSGRPRLRGVSVGLTTVPRADRTESRCHRDGSGLGDARYSTIKPLLDWLDYNGYAVVTKPTKKVIDAGGYRKFKGKMDIEVAVDAMALAEYVDEIVLFSGNAIF